MIECRENDYEHYVKCGSCGWEGWSAWMRHGYQAFGGIENNDIEPVDFCPQCDTSEEFAEIMVTCHRDCDKCSERYVCHTTFTKLPVNDMAFIPEKVVMH